MLKASLTLNFVEGPDETYPLRNLITRSLCVKEVNRSDPSGFVICDGIHTGKPETCSCLSKPAGLFGSAFLQRALVTSKGWEWRSSFMSAERIYPELTVTMSLSLPKYSDLPSVFETHWL